jgi:2-(1,2-epoxy-1,2-dihydrophenyl)acetyl-CoA isomerase
MPARAHCDAGAITPATERGIGMNDSLLLERRDGVLWITLNRPKSMNAMNEEMFGALTTLFEALPGDSAVRALVLRGAGADFSSGGDLKDIGPVLELPPAERTAALSALVRSSAGRLFLAMDRVPQPILLSARGHVIGAAVQMAAVADLVIASETARFSIPQVKLAHTVDHGESFHLPRKVGLARAMEICLLGDRIAAADAARFGLVNWVVADTELDGRTEELASRLAAAPPVALRGMKQLLKASEGNAIETQFAAESDMIGRCVATEDFVEAIRAFSQKRRPTFVGR